MKLIILTVTFLVAAGAAAAPKKGKEKYKSPYPSMLDRCESGLLSSYDKEAEEERRREREEQEEERRREREERQKAESVGLKKELTDLLRSNAGVSSHLTDLMNVYRLKKALLEFGSPDSVALLIGNGVQRATEDVIKRSKYLVEFALKQGSIVIYDAESNIAGTIAEAAGEYGLGISSGEAKGTTGNVLVIKNPYLRLIAFSAAKKVAINDDSLTGLGLALNNSASHHMSSRFAEKSSFGFSAWEPSYSERNFGIRLDRVEWLSLPKVDLKSLKLDSDEQLIDSLSYQQLVDAKRFPDSMDKSAQRMIEHQPASGAVVFGSGGYPGSYSYKIGETVKYLASEGIPIVTGGAGGVMEIANRAAYEAGSDSIGIGLGGRLDTERETMSSIHTLSISVHDYQERIPLLLGDRKLVVIAPGGMGTMKELATTLIAAAGKKDWNTAIVFLGRDYYRRMYEGLAQVLPKEIAKHVHLIDGRSDMEELLKFYNNEIWSEADKSQVYREEKPVPRYKFKLKESELHVTPKEDKKEDSGKTEWWLKPFSWMD